MGCKDCSGICLQCLFDYETPVMLVIKTKRVGALFRLIQLLIITYVAVYVCWIQRAYQDTDSVISSVSTKVKGNILTNSFTEGVHVWDIPEWRKLFVLTNMIVTPGQTQSKCPEVQQNTFICFVNFHTRRDHSVFLLAGVQTGQCVQYSEKIQTCEVQAWCLLENDTIIPKPAISAAEDFTVLIKNIQYPKRNILHHINSTYLKNCTFDRKTDPDCPIFRLGNMVTEAGKDFSVVAHKTGVMMDFWTCDLDFPERFCIPKYSFRRLNNENPENNVAPDNNNFVLSYRFAKYYKNNENIETRTLIKAFGIRFDVIVFGTAGKSNIVPTIVNIGATLSFLSLVNAVCDWFMFTGMKDRVYYAKHKLIHLNQKGDECATGE
uniref:P2X purinoceptor n=1 Tax=Sinocyclocheilus grahami TaxID=75366 RepID=A0A672R7W6_SINGR